MLRYIFTIMTFSFFSFANIPHTVIHITDQTQNTDSISRDTDNASFTMTEINTEVLDIRADISKDISKDGFKAVGDLAMEQDWEDGSIEKTLAHTAMGAVVAGIGNGDALGGALGAGAAEAVRPLTEGKDDATQQWVSAAIGAVASGGTGASTGLDGEKFNRQLHQREIAWIKEHAGEYKALHPELSEAEAIAALTNQALRSVDAIWSVALGQEDKDAQAFIQTNTGGDTTLFHASQSDFYNPTINMDIAKKHPELYAQARDKGKEILSDPAKLRGALALRLGVDTLQNTLEAAAAKAENAEAVLQIARDLESGKITKTEALEAAYHQGEDVVEGIIHSAVAVGKGLYGQATTSDSDFEQVYGNGAGDEIENLTWAIIGASVAVNGRHKGKGGKGKGDNEDLSLLDDKAKTHILDGEVRNNGSYGGGHRYGTGYPNKSEFPKNWSDTKIQNVVSDIATDPKVTWITERNGYKTTTRTVDGVDIKVVYDPNKGRIVSGYPTNTPRNPK